MMNNPAIVIAAYNRPKSLRRLLNALINAEFHSDAIPLHISIDRSDNKEVEEIASDFEWKHGTKNVVVHSDHLGLKAHILACGKLTETYENIILLEDDLIVSMHFYDFAKQALDFYENDERISGISLYNYQVAESCFLPFQPILDGSDVYFMQFASSWGQAWSKSQWSKFENWLTKNGDDKLNLLPTYMHAWGEKSWKKYFINYMIDQDLYFTFPRESLTTNFEDPGTNATTKGVYQTNLLQGKKTFQWSTLDESRSVYDAYFEPSPKTINAYTTSFIGKDYAVDLYGKKPIESFSSEFVLTTKGGINAVASFSHEMRPLVQNVISNLAGSSIGFYRKDDVHDTEPNSSYFVPASTVKLVRDNLLNTISISIIIPVSEFDAQKLNRTLESFANQYATLEIIISYSEKWSDLISKEISGLENCKLRSIESDNMWHLLKDGMDHSSGEIISWCKPGTTLNNNVLTKIGTLFASYRQVSFINGVNPLEDGKNLSQYRYNLEIALKSFRKNQPISTELFFFKNDIYKSVRTDENFTVELLILHLLRKYELYTTNLRLGEILSTKQTIQTKIVPDNFSSVKKNKLISPIMPLFRWFYQKNFPYLRSFFIEVNALPLVIRENHIYGTFYLTKN